MSILRDTILEPKISVPIFLSVGLCCLQYIVYISKEKKKRDDHNHHEAFRHTDAMGAFSNANNVPENDEHSSFRVLGIAMVVDQRGKEARTVMRYPTSATTISNSSSSLDGNQDLFYKLPGRQMAKLFRPKPALCGQPMTLSIGGTIFCCCAVLMEDDNNSNNNDTGTAGYQSDDDTKDNLVLFSVIVALAPQVRTPTMGIGGWMEAQAAGGGSSRNSQEEQQHKPHQAEQSPLDMLQGKMSAPTQGRASESFLSIRRVHVSLGRLCRVLEREERRCRYVSVQANLFDQIRHDLSSSKGNNNEKYSYWQHHHSNQFNQHNTEEQHNHSPKNTKKAPPSSTTSATAAPANAVVSPPLLPPPAPVATPPPNSPASLVSSKAGTKGSAAPPPPPPPPNRQHRRAGSNFTVSFEREITVAAKTTPSEQEKLEEKSRLQELEQVIMETMMAVVIVEHQGNLARELVQVYHAMGRNSHDFPPTPANLLSGREGVVYINRHIAIAIEPVSSVTPTTTTPPDHSSGGGFALRRRPVVRPYHTLLFPDASPSQLLESMAATTASRSVAPRRLQQLLRMVSPQKSLTDIAVDTNLPLPTTLDIAAYLVGQGACRASPVLSRKIRLASHHGGTSRIRRAALAFSQDFGTAVNLFGLVGFLTEPVVGGRNLGDAMTLLTTSNEENIVWLRECFLSCLTARNNRGTGSSSSQELAGGGVGSAAAVVQGRIDAFADHHPVGSAVGADDHRGVLPKADDIEELLYQMVVWLCSHEVLVQLQDYLLAKLPAGDGSVADSARTIDENESMHQELDETNPRYHTQHYAERKSDSNLRLDLLSDDLLVQELLDSDCCTGRVTVQACCWKTGMDPIKLYQLVARCPKQLRLVTRVPYPGDDWEGEADE